ncbi:MAG: alkylmercury lyase [Mycobacterium sp.]|nr:alkylmercury lyase [Mycobacterium sp.]
MRIELLTHPGCPNAEQTRHVVRDCLQALNIHAEITETVGDHPSPTVLIDGVDAMTGHIPVEHGRACRLDLPTRVRIVAALRSSVAGTP